MKEKEAELNNRRLASLSGMNPYSEVFNQTKQEKSLIDEGIINGIDLELLFTDIKDKKGKKFELSDEYMELFRTFWEIYLKEKITSHLATYFKNEKSELEKEIERLDKQIHKLAPSNCPKCGVKLSNYKAIDKHVKKYKHYGDYSKFDNKRPDNTGLLEDYKLINAKLTQLNKDAKNILGEKKW